jgi:hypothetical protein
MSDQFLLPGYYRILSAIMVPYGTRQGVDISGLIHKLIVEESIENDSIRGYFSIIDSVGLLETLPIRGEERLQIEVEDILKQKKIYDLFLYKVENVIAKETNDTLSYDVFFISYMRWNAGKRRIIDSFDRSVRETAEEIFKRYYAPFTKKFNTESTEGNLQCIIPNYTPPQAMRFLASRAFSNISPSCSFRFFENSEAFYFVSDEWLVAEAIRTDNIKEFSYISNVSTLELNSSNNPAYDVNAQLKNIIELKNTDSINTVKDLYSGGYKSNPIVIDFVNKTVTDNRYSYQDSKTKFASLNAGSEKIEDLHSDDFINYTFTDENERRFLVFKDYQSAEDLPTSIRSEQYLPDIISRRLTYRHLLYRNIVNVKIYGRLDIKAGDVVKLVIPELSANSEKKSFDSKLSGNYLVHDCTHIFDREVYEISMTLTKFDWRKD